MSSDKDTVIKKKNNSMWTIITVILLISNVIFFFQLAYVMSRYYVNAMLGFVLLPSALILAIIDFIAVLFYIITKHPHGMARIVSDAVLIIVSTILLIFGGAFIYNFIIPRFH